MRLLEQKKIAYKPYCYKELELTNGAEIAKALGEDPRLVFKTLVTVSKSKQNYVFVIPVEEELDLKAAAKAVGEKSIAMIPQKELLPLTGYVHGGCSPIGMKKTFPTVIHETAQEYETILFSGGKVGYQVEVALSDLEKMVRLQYADIIVHE
ncbi:MAG: Cys-tRNA(Pro) deacylase [Lachnospiraceae bacterium]|nr:Cys-tRNA(Pro) deacylase [Lachnospiraceae bacterium]